MTMRRYSFVISLFAFASVLVPSRAAAQSVDWHFIGVASYEVNLNRPPSGSNQLRVFDTSDGQMRLNLAGLSFVRAAQPLGFHIDLVSGKDVPTFASAGAPKPDVIDISQAFVSWKGARGLEIRVGKFATTAGYEVIPDATNTNVNFSRSFLFGYALPGAHTGLRALVPLTSATTLTAGVNRGWDKITDNNGSLSYELAVTSSPRPWLTLSADTHQGPERAHSRDWRQLYDGYGIATRDPWMFAASVNYATEKNGRGNDRWYGAALYTRYAFSAQWAVALRTEEFHDVTGSRTGAAQRLREVTLTADWSVGPHVVVRAEGRIDRSSSAVFERSGQGTLQQQPTAALAVIVKK
jgi:hypothetical protein